MAGNLRRFWITNDITSGYLSGARSGQAWKQAIMHKVNLQYLGIKPPQGPQTVSTN